MKFQSLATPRYHERDTRSIAHFCLLPMSFVVINRETNERQNVTYWLETVEIEERYTQGRQRHFWKPIRVNGLVLD